MGGLGARGHQELPLFTASSWMETVPIAGKFWQSSHEPPCDRGEKAPVALIKSVEKGDAREGGMLRNKPMHNNTNA